MNIDDFIRQSRRLSEMKDYQGAIQILTQAIRLEPGYASAYYSRASARESLEDYQGAIEDCQKATNLSLEQGDMKGYEDAIDMQKSRRLISS